MGVRFACQACGKRLHVKAELAGKRGICPKCGERFRIPLADQEWSIRLGSPEDPRGAAPTAAPRTDQPGTHAPATPATPAATGTRRSPDRPDQPDQPGGLLDSEPEAIWYVRPPSGGQYGPARSPLLRQWVEEHRVAADALVWRDGWPQWREAIDVFPEYATELPGTQTPAADASDEAGTTQAGVGNARVGNAGTGNARTGGRVPATGGTGEGAAGTTVDVEIRPVDPRRPALEGGVWLGARRLARRNRRVWAIVVLVLISLLLVVALIIVSTRPPAATTTAPPKRVPDGMTVAGPGGLFGGRWVAGWSWSG